MATIAEFSSGFPGHLDPHPVRERVHLRGARRARLQHVLRREVAPHAGRGVQPRRVQGPLAARARLRALLRVPRRRGEPVVSRTSCRTTARSTRPRRRRRATTCSKDLADQAIGMIKSAKVIDPDKPFFMYLAPGCGHAPHHVFTEWADKYKGTFDHGYEAIRAEILARQKELGLLPDDTELSPINPHGEPERTGPDGQPWPVLDTVRPWDSLSADEQRLFARMAEVFAGFVSYTDDQIGRVLDYLEESGQLDNTIVVVDLRQRRQRRGRPQRLVQRVALLQRRAPTRPTSTLPHIDDLGTPEVVQPLLHRVGVGVRHAVPVLEAVGRATKAASPTCAWSRGRRRSSRRTRCATSTSTRSTSSRPSTTSSASNRPRCSRATRRARSRARASRPRSPIRRRPGRRRSSTRCSVSARSTTRAGWRAPCTRRSAGWGKFELDEWELYDLEHDRAQSKNVAADNPNGSRR